MYVSAIASDRHSTPIRGLQFADGGAGVPRFAALPPSQPKSLALGCCTFLHLPSVDRYSPKLWGNCDAAISTTVARGNHVLKIGFRHRSGALPKVCAKITPLRLLQDTDQTLPACWRCSWVSPSHFTHVFAVPICADFRNLSGTPRAVLATGPT